MDYQTLIHRKGIESEIRQLERDIARKETEAAAATSILSHQPRPPRAGDKVGRLAAEIADLQIELKKRIAERDEVQRYISSIPDSDVRTALRMYFLQGKSWLKVGRVLYCDESTIRRRVKRYIQGFNLPDLPD